MLSLKNLLFSLLHPVWVKRVCPCVCFVDLDIVSNALTHSHTSCLLTANKEEEEEQEGEPEKKEGEEEEASFPKGNGAKVKRKMYSFTTEDRRWFPNCLKPQVSSFTCLLLNIRRLKGVS